MFRRPYAKRFSPRCYFNIGVQKLWQASRLAAKVNGRPEGAGSPLLTQASRVAYSDLLGLAALDGKLDELLGYSQAAAGCS